MRSLKTWLRNLSGDRSGNTAILVAVGMPALIASAGLGVDVSQWFLWKSELQQATDQAALAAAWSRAKNETYHTSQVRGTQDFENNLTATKDFASAPSFTLANWSNGSNNSVVVTATASTSLPFTSIILKRPVTISVHSQATFASGSEFKACLRATADTGTSFTIGGNANVQAKCGLSALSCSRNDDPDSSKRMNALEIDDSATVATDSIAVCGTASVPPALQGVLYEGENNLSDPFFNLAPPTNDTPQEYSCSKGGSKKATPQPGTYSEFVVKCTTTMAKGIYVIDGGTLDLSGNFNVTGTGVMFVLKNGATLKLGGEGVNTNTITLTPMEAGDFINLGYDVTLADNYANMLIFEDRNNNPQSDHTINGNANSLFKGTIYLPAGTAKLNGTSELSSTCLQISAKYIHILGSAQLDTQCPSALTDTTGYSTGKVSLVV